MSESLINTENSLIVVIDKTWSSPTILGVFDTIDKAKEAVTLANIKPYATSYIQMDINKIYNPHLIIYESNC